MAGERRPGDPPRPTSFHDGQPSPPRSPSHRSSGVWGLNGKLGLEELVCRVQDVLCLSRPIKFTEELPRLALYNHIRSGPPISRQEERELLQQFDHVLKQAQAFVRAMDMQPVELNDVKLYQQIPRHRPQPSFAPLYMVEPQLRKKEKENREILKVVQSFSADLKGAMAAGVRNNEMSPEFAKELRLHMDCLDRNMKMVMESNGYCFSRSGLAGLLTIPDWLKSFSGRMAYYPGALQKLLTIADCVIENIGTSPVQYNCIFKEANSILHEDFCSKKLKFSSDPNETVSVSFGAESYGDEPMRQTVLKVTWGNKSLFSLDAADCAGNAVFHCPVNGMAGAPHLDAADVFSTELSFDDIYGNDLKTVIQLKYPSLNSKVEIEGRHPYYTYAGGIGLNRAINGLGCYPTIKFSGLFGVKSLGAGVDFSFDAENIEVRGGVGVSMRANLCAIGFAFTHPGMYKASICKKLVDSTTTVAAKASYSPVAGEPQGLKFTVGLKHAINPELYLKARAGTGGVSVAMKKSCYVGKCTVRAAAHVGYNQWCRPNLGVMLSFHS